MARRLKLAAHDSIEVLERYYRQAKDPIERTRAQIIWLLAQGRLSEEVAQVTGYCIEWVRAVARRYNAKGLPGLADRRHDNPGHAPLLGAEQAQALEVALGEPPEDAGLWNGPKVAHWMEQTLGRPVKREIGWSWLRRLGYTVQVPRPYHTQGDPAAQEAFKKRSPRATRRPAGASRPRTSSRSGRWMSTGWA